MKATITGNALVITSGIKAEDIIKIRNARPKALVLTEEEDGVKTQVFGIDINLDGEAVVDDMGIVFNGTTHDENKYATATLLLCGDVGDIKETVAELFGLAITRLQKLEATLPEVLDQVNADHAALLDAITVE